MMARKEVSPRGLRSAIGMVQFFINRAADNLMRDRRRERKRQSEYCNQGCAQ
jgi:hypothetical protein